MKIGILTVPFNNNYGGFLQAYALKEVLVSRGHNVYFINRRRNLPSGIRNKVKRILCYLGLYKDKYKIRENQISIYTNEFKKKYLEPITEPYYSNKEIKKCLKYGFDCIVVGSDQVWRYKYAKKSIKNYYCDFLCSSSIPRFSYAASMGTQEMEYPQNELSEVRELLKRFDAVSVREDSSVSLLKKYFDYGSATKVLDPTLLLSKDIYCKLIGEKYKRPDCSYIFVYVLDMDETISLDIKEFAALNNYNIISINAQTGDINKIKYIEPVEKWLSAIYYADCVITDSFHGTVFSILFQKPFVVLGNETRGITRINDLLSMFCLDNRLRTDGVTIADVLMNDINWDKVVKILELNKTKSYQFIESALEKAENIKKS